MSRVKMLAFEFLSMKSKMKLFTDSTLLVTQPVYNTSRRSFTLLNFVVLVAKERFKFRMPFLTNTDNAFGWNRTSARLSAG